ncbi:MAG: phosphodiester glycosidase family protein, partial [Bacteroidales bacterium]|nr:phosphodiester glycosidase family protein [Bacteroidales bacterium]
ANGTEMPFSAYAVTVDMSKGYHFVPYYNKDKGNMTVTQMVDDYESVNGTMPLIGINTGYFSSTSSYSLIIKDNEVMSNNIAQLSRDGSFYVTRGAFSHDAANNFSADWVYTIEDGTVYGYPNPSPNVDGETPQPKPSASFPANGFVYDRTNAIGGGPLLIRNGDLVSDYGYELFYDDIIRSIANRTAIGVTASNELVILVVNGRASYSDGITLRDMASILKNDFGCVHALNLDGGGSSTLVLNGDLYNQNSIDVGQRSVLTGLLIVK